MVQLGLAVAMWAALALVGAIVVRLLRSAFSVSVENDPKRSCGGFESSDSLRENTRRSYRSFMHCENDRIPPPPLRQSQALAARGGNLINRWRVTNGG